MTIRNFNKNGGKRTTEIAFTVYKNLFSRLTCGSIIRGHRSEFDRIVAFSVDIRSLGKPSLCHFAICVSSVNNARGSRFSVMGTAG